jgi:hypothetical protein
MEGIVLGKLAKFMFILFYFVIIYLFLHLGLRNVYYKHSEPRWSVSEPVIYVGSSRIWDRSSAHSNAMLDATSVILSDIVIILIKDAI